MLYMNSVYDWPFDATHALGAQNIDVLDIHGKPHVEQCDPGIFPSFFLDHGRPAGQAAFLSIFKKHIISGLQFISCTPCRPSPHGTLVMTPLSPRITGSADGVYLDCFDEIPMSCSKTNSSDCKAIRNHAGNNASLVSPAQVEAYTLGKKAGLKAATAMVDAASGGIFLAKTWQVTHSHDPYGANTAIVPYAATPAGMKGIVKKVMVQNGYKYMLFGGGYSNLRRSETDLESKCTDYQVAVFMLGMEPGCFLICQGWSEDFGKPIGRPRGPAVTTGGVMKRSFASGATVEWELGTQNTTIIWAQ